ncbi:MAG: DUF4330 domain-containing protein [Oscillospiraceae bacterium]|jgi:flagellar motor component MotA|nr:DUF4330 domain-containing protein [Oscillospiraceae bacterium]
MKRIIDENGRIFGKVSVIDVIVILAAAVVVLVVATKKNVVEQVSGTLSTVPVEYTVEALNLRVPVAELLREGDYIWLESGVPAGRITAVEIKDAETISQKADGTYVIGKVESKVDVFITVLADCSVSDGRYFADRTFELNVNQEQKYVTKYAAITGTIGSITPGTK